MNHFRQTYDWLEMINQTRYNVIGYPLISTQDFLQVRPIATPCQYKPTAPTTPATPVIASKYPLDKLKKLLGELHTAYALPYNNTVVLAAKAKAHDFFQELNLPINKAFSSIEELVGFLQQFPANEQILYLALYTQAFFANEDNNSIYTAQEVFARQRGECDDLAIFYCETLKRLGISAKLYILSNSLSYQVQGAAGYHAFSYFTLPDGTSGSIDNEGLYAEHMPGKSLNHFVWDTYPGAYDYYPLNKTTYQKYRTESTLVANEINHKASYMITITREKALQLLGSQDLINIFMINPDEDLLFFKPETIKLLKEFITDPEKAMAVYTYFYTTYRH